MTALLTSPWFAPAVAVLGLLAVAAGVGLGVLWDDLAASIRDYHTPPTGAHRR